MAGVFALSLAALFGLLGLALGPRLEEARRLAEALTQIQHGDSQGCGLGSLHARLAQLQGERRAHLMRLQQSQRAALAEPAAGSSPRGAQGNVLESVSSHPGKLGDGNENHGGVGVALAGSWENPAVTLKREEVEFWPSQTQTEIGAVEEDASWKFSWDPASTRAAPARSRDLNLQRLDPPAGGELLGDIPADSGSPMGDTIETGAKGGGRTSRPTAARKLITSIFGTMFEDCGSGEGAAENGADVGVSRSSFRANSSGSDVLREYSLAADRAIDWAASVRALHRNQHLRDVLAYRALLALRELAFRRALAEALSLPAPGAAATAATGSDYFHVAWSVSPHFARCAEVCYAGGLDSATGVAREPRERSRDCRSAGSRREAILPAILSGRDCSCSPDGEERLPGRAEPALLPVAALERCLMRRAAASLGEMRRDVLSGLSLLLVLALASCAAHALALSSFARVTAWLGAQARRLAGRTRRLRTERARAEELLHEMLPRAVAAQLRSSHHVQAESFDKVTIFFADVVRFTEIAARCSPLQVVEILNALYMCFDRRIEAYDVYKVETIGDAYMVASGLPERNGDVHAHEIARMALDLVAAVRQVNTDGLRLNGTLQPLQLRAGIHTGPCVAGVVGYKMPRYCLFGDTVNTASRMETTSLPQKIHISSATYAELSRDEAYIIEPRGEIQVKGKGIMKTYWLLGHRDYSVHNDSLVCHWHPRTRRADRDASSLTTIAEKTSPPPSGSPGPRADAANRTPRDLADESENGRQSPPKDGVTLNAAQLPGRVNHSYSPEG